MQSITVVPLSTPQTVTVAAWDAMKKASALFLQTERHASAAPVLRARLAYRSMDDLYESAEDFDALNIAIAERLLCAGDCVYAVTGNIADSQLPVIRRLAEQKGVGVTVLAGVPYAMAAFPDKAVSRIVTAARLPQALDPLEPLCIEEISDRILAGDVKLTLSEYYPDDWEILLANMDEEGAFKTRAVPLYTLDRQRCYGAEVAAYIPPARFEDLTRYGYAELVAVMARLRAPGGCPWDQKQTHASLKEPLLEECYELLDAIDSGDDAHICEETGDVLMQAVFHAEIAAEQQRFTERDVTTELVKKLVYRHPHVFGSVRADTAEEVLQNWDKLKRTEKSQATVTDVLNSVPRNLPALTRAYKVQKKAAGVGFDWPDAHGALDKVAEEAEELRQAMDGSGDISEEMGDLLFSAVNVSRLLHVNPELQLLAAADKFTQRFQKMEELAVSEGLMLENMTLDEMDLLWERIKSPEFSEKSQKQSCQEAGTLVK